MLYLGIFGLAFKKTIVIVDISTLKFDKYLFGIRSTFSNKDPRSAFFEGAGPSPLYEVCRHWRGFLEQLFKSANTGVLCPLRMVTKFRLILKQINSFLK